MTNSGWRPPVARYARIRQRLFILRPKLVFPTSLWGPKCIIILLGGGSTSTLSSPSLVSPHTPNLNILVVFNKIYTFIHWWFFWWQCWRWQRLQSLTDYDDQYLDWLPAQYYWQPREGREKNSRDLGKWITTMGVARRFFQNIGGSNIKLYFHGMKLHFTDLNSFADHFSLSRGLQRVAKLIIVCNFSRTGSAWHKQMMMKIIGRYISPTTILCPHWKWLGIIDRSAAIHH